MLIKQIQFTNCTEEELGLIPDFLEWLIDNMYMKLNTKINRRKITLRLKYLMEVPWISWNKKTDITDTQTIMECIYDSFSYEEQNYGLWVLTTNSNVILPNTTTSFDRIIRFLEYGDIKFNATGMFNKLNNEYNYHKINNLWKTFILTKYGIGITDSKLLTD